MPYRVKKYYYVHGNKWHIYFDITCCNKTAGFTIIIRIDTSIGIRPKYPWATEFMFSI